jgi:hypothetical protein
MIPTFRLDLILQVLHLVDPEPIMRVVSPWTALYGYEIQGLEKLLNTGCPFPQGMEA